MVKLSDVVPPMGMVAAPNDLLMFGGETTNTEAVDVFPVPPLLELTVTLLLFCPAVVPLTLTEKVHEMVGTNVAPDRLTEVEPAVAVMVPPPHDPVRPF